MEVQVTDEHHDTGAALDLKSTRQLNSAAAMHDARTSLEN